MPIRYRVRRAIHSRLNQLKRPPGRGVRILLPIVVVLLAVLTLGIYLRRLSRDIAISDARDAVTMAVNDCVSSMMRENDYSSDYFVILEKDQDGQITAITTNTAHINAFASQLMGEIARAADRQSLDIRIPLGSLLGSNLLMGRGPSIPVQVKMLTSSFVSFENDLISTGINQSRHIVTLKANVDIDILIPLSTVTTAVQTDIPIAETVIVGRVPNTYATLTEDQHGSK